LPLLPIFFIGTRSFELSCIDFLLFLDIAIGQDNLAALLEKEKDAGDVLVAYAQLEDVILLIEQLRQRWPMPLTCLELLDPCNGKFVQGAVLLSQPLQEGENRFISFSVVEKADTKLHLSPAV
jgi:hypothetical protein